MDSMVASQTDDISKIFTYKKKLTRDVLFLRKKRHFKCIYTLEIGIKR